MIEIWNHRGRWESCTFWSFDIVSLRAICKLRVHLLSQPVYLTWSFSTFHIDWGPALKRYPSDLLTRRVHSQSSSCFRIRNLTISTDYQLSQLSCCSLWKLEDFSLFESMLELRQRSKSSGSMTYGGYQAVDTDDDSDTTPLLDIHRLVEAPVERSTVCKCVL